MLDLKWIKWETTENVRRYFLTQGFERAQVIFRLSPLGISKSSVSLRKQALSHFDIGRLAIIGNGKDNSVLTAVDPRFHNHSTYEHLVS